MSKRKSTIARKRAGGPVGSTARLGADANKYARGSSMWIRYVVKAEQAPRVIGKPMTALAHLECGHVLVCSYTDGNFPVADVETWLPCDACRDEFLGNLAGYVERVLTDGPKKV